MSELKLKNTIGEGTKMFWKYQLAVWLSIQNFYSHFTKVTRKCECFGRIVEPCPGYKLFDYSLISGQNTENLFLTFGQTV